MTEAMAENPAHQHPINTLCIINIRTLIILLSEWVSWVGPQQELRRLGPIPVFVITECETNGGSNPS